MSDTIFVDRGGFRLAVRVTGVPDGPALVLSNSLGASMAMWEPQRALLERRYRVVAYDTRGHGASDAPPGPYSFEDLTADVVAILDHLGIERASFMGLSLGGMTGLGLAIHHADRFDRVVCCDARADAPPPFVQGWDDRIAAVQAGGMSSIWPGTAERWFVQRFRDAHPDVMERMRAMFTATSVQGYRGCAEALKRLDYRRHLGGIALPVLYVVGEKDAGAPAAVMRDMAEATPGAEFREIPDAAHLPNVDASADFDAAIAPFLGLS